MKVLYQLFFERKVSDQVKFKLRIHLKKYHLLLKIIYYKFNINYYFKIKINFLRIFNLKFLFHYY